jgi:hypothetical protein
MYANPGLPLLRYDGRYLGIERAVEFAGRAP